MELLNYQKPKYHAGFASIIPPSPPFPKRNNATCLLLITQLFSKSFRFLYYILTSSDLHMLICLSSHFTPGIYFFILFTPTITVQLAGLV